MEELDAQTIEELKAKAIERGGDETEDITTNEIDEELKEPDVVEEEPVPKRIEEVKKPKRQRSEKQKAAFEKARLARAENLKIKKQIEAEKKQKQKEEKEQVKIEVKKRLSADHSVKPAPAPASIPQAVEQRYQTEQPRYREQVVNNYYYYGATPSGAMEWQDPEPPPVQKRGLRQGKKKKVVVKEPEPESSSESESASEAEEEIIYSDPEEPEIYKELQNFNEEVDRGLPPPKSNGLKFRFA